MATGVKRKGRLPDYHIKAMDHGTPLGKVAAAWKNPDGSITIKLDTCVVLEERLDLLYTAFPYKPPTTDVKRVIQLED